MSVRTLPTALLVTVFVAASSASGTSQTGVHTTSEAARTVPRGTVVYTARYRSETALFVIGADGSNSHRVNSWGETPAWSPDGTRLAYSSLDTGTYIARANGTHARELGAGVGICYAPAWSPNGRMIACFGPTQSDGEMSLVYDDPPSLWLIDVIRGRSTRLCACGDIYDPPIEAPSWSPDGTRLAFSDGGIKVIDVRSGRIRALGAGRNPDWSPDGRQIAYSGGRDFNEGHTIGVIRADGSDRRVIVSSPVELVDEPAWAPNGKQLVYATFAPFGAGPEWRHGYAGAARGLRIVTSTGRQVSVLTRRGFEPDWG